LIETIRRLWNGCPPTQSYCGWSVTIWSNFLSIQGEKIGPFEITAKLGQGGMGVVYLARDTRLNRDVGIKALPEELASDPARLERFEREARTLAQLNHPNVAGIHGVEEAGGHTHDLPRLMLHNARFHARRASGVAWKVLFGSRIGLTSASGFR
jgi:serine/threonine protein kinase